MKRKLFTLILVLAIVQLTAGFACNKTKSLQTSMGVAASLQAMQQGEIGMHNLGKIDDPEHRLLQQGFIVLAKSDKDVRQCIYISGLPSCVDVGINAVNNLIASPAVVGIKNPDAQQQMKLLGQSLIVSLNTLKAAL